MFSTVRFGSLAVVQHLISRTTAIGRIAVVRDRLFRIKIVGFSGRALQCPLFSKADVQISPKSRKRQAAFGHKRPFVSNKLRREWTLSGISIRSRSLNNRGNGIAGNLQNLNGSSVVTGHACINSPHATVAFRCDRLLHCMGNHHSFRT